MLIIRGPHHMPCKYHSRHAHQAFSLMDPPCINWRPINQILILPWLGIIFNSKWTIRNGKKDGFTKKLAIILIRTLNGLIPVLPFLVAKALHLGSKERSNTWIGPLYWRAWKINSLFNKDFVWKLEYLITRVNVVNFKVICKVARTSNQNPQFP